MHLAAFASCQIRPSAGRGCAGIGLEAKATIGIPAQRPRFAAYHNVDVLQLLATGMCFGVALSALVMWARNRSVT